MRSLFIGLGGSGQRHLRILKELRPDIKFAAVREKGRTFEIGDNLKAQKNVNIEEKYKIKTFKSITDAMVFEPNFSVVANPTSLHVKTVMELVKNKTPVLVEKPLSDSIKDLDNLIQLSKSYDTTVMAGYMMRFNPCAKLLHNYIKKKALGRIYNILLNINSYMPEWHEYELYNDFYAGRKDLGGGVVLTEIHEIDLLHWFFEGPSKLAAIGGKKSDFDFDVEDTVSILMEMNEKDNYFPVSINMSFVQKTPMREFLILGEYGRLKWNIMSHTLYFDDYEHDNHETHHFSEFDRNDMFRDQMNHFLNCLENRKSPLTEISKIIDGQKTAFAIKKAIGKEYFVVP